MAGVKILIVEDETIVAMDMQRRLGRLGYEVAGVAGSGEEALIRAEETRPDLALMDIMLAGKIDGIETAERMRRRFDIPVLYITAYADEETLDRARATEPIGYIIKPFEERAVHAAIEMALYRHSTRKPARRGGDKEPRDRGRRALPQHL
jgi:CheY-like chemotaxis protein